MYTKSYASSKFSLYFLLVSISITVSARVFENLVSDTLVDDGQDVREIQGRSSNAASTTTTPSSALMTHQLANDCYGLGQLVSSKIIEPLLKNVDNGTNAQNSIFYLLSRKKPHRNQVPIGEQFGLEWTDFEIERDTVIIVHGYLSSGDEDWVRDMATAYLSYADANVIVADWSAGSAKLNYVEAALNTQTTGNQLATLLGQISNYFASPSSSSNRGRLHCIGHSLGSHVCGYAAHEMKRRDARWLMRRITGLDPAQPCFQKVDLALRLDKGDADFVDVIHTNGGFLSELGLGFPQAIGHVDFYPNGGKQQPGCALPKSRFPLLPNPKRALINTVCSHGRSYLYFTESLYNAVAGNCTFKAYPWDRTYRGIEKIFSENYESVVYTEMGIKSERYAYRGSFFTLTSASEPYCDVEYCDKVKIERILKEDLKGTLHD